MKNRGFSLLETLVALAVLVTAIVGPITLAAQSIHSISAARNEITAIFLAQDAIEYVRAKKASNSYQSLPWLSGFGNGSNTCFNPTLGCFIDTVRSSGGVTSAPGSCGNPNPPVACYIKKDPSSGVYTYLSGNSTIFIRRINIQRRCTNGGASCLSGEEREANVRVEVSWRERFGTRTIALETEIFCYERAALADCDDNIDDGI